MSHTFRQGFGIFTLIPILLCCVWYWRGSPTFLWQGRRRSIRRRGWGKRKFFRGGWYWFKDWNFILRERCWPRQGWLTSMFVTACRACTAVSSPRVYKPQRAWGWGGTICWGRVGGRWGRYDMVACNTFNSRWGLMDWVWNTARRCVWLLDVFHFNWEQKISTIKLFVKHFRLLFYV